MLPTSCPHSSVSTFVSLGKSKLIPYYIKEAPLNNQILSDVSKRNPSRGLKKHFQSPYMAKFLLWSNVIAVPNRH